jgi:predicted RNase H-like HicB family nuclease
MTDQPNAAVFKAWLLRNSSNAWMAISAELVGCYALGGTESEALANLATAIPAFYAWLSRHDDYTPTLSGAIRVEPVGVLDMAPGLGTIFLADDNEPVNDEDLDWLLAVLGWAYDDLLSEARRYPNSPQREALLMHTARRQAEFITYALGVAAPDFPGDGLAGVTAARQTALHMFRNSSPVQRAAILQTGGQCWSLRSGIRASILLTRRAAEEFVKL